MKISRFYLNTLLSGIVVVLTFSLAIAYLVQPASELPEQYTYGTDDTPATYSEIQEIDSKITALETLMAEEQAQAKKHKSKQAERIRELKMQLEEKTSQLVASQETENLTKVMLSHEQDTTEQLSIQLSGEKARAREQEINLTSNSAQVLMLDKTLQQEKDYVLRLSAKFEAEKMRLLAVSEELDLKKSELVKNKRELASTYRALTKKKRELTISQGKINDINRKNELLNRKMIILNAESNNLRQTSRGKTIAASPNS